MGWEYPFLVGPLCCQKVWSTDLVQNNGITLDSFKKFVAEHKREHVQLDFLADRVEALFAEVPFQARHGMRCGELCKVIMGRR